MEQAFPGNSLEFYSSHCPPSHPTPARVDVVLGEKASVKKKPRLF